MIAFVLFWAQFLVVGNLLIMPVLLLGVRDGFSLDACSMGLLLAAFPLMALIGNLFVGRFIDKVGRPLSLQLGLCMSAACFLLMFFAENGSAAIVSRGLTGLCMPLIGASLYAVIADVYAGQARRRVTALVSTAASLAGLVILPLGIGFSTAARWHYVFLAFAMASLGLGVISYFSYYRRYAPARAEAAGVRQGAARLYLDDGVLRSYALLYWFQGFAYFALISWMPSYFQRLLDDGESSMALFFGGAGAVLGAWCLTALAGRRAKTFYVVLGINGIAVLSLAASTLGLWAACAAWFVYNACRQLLSAHILSGANAHCGNSDRGTLNATMNVGYQAVGAVAAFVVAQLPFVPDSISIICIMATLMLLPGFYFYKSLGRSDAL
ncbi:MFS transporter [Pseudomonas chlororaphis]|uniref:MFS transporter n=1 Tax=Pseudomonas chlororaphis TaxID=587753 RepID=UPI0006A587E2|nr:MFS transporter [Pseudomonas chlororaphis]MBM0283022.1 MFS transporter [Pseudomonas chlororaphis]MDO1507249.1 MFS transporter [Pseudomonas chlororaphis]ORM45456.1 MFS transporter [Pseudomonas chlororaphis subsp. chlororaphis]TWR98655.1 MFS transporter [Pseudomonas chlororaphis subsp. chlororaphis]WDH00186.1 MFS transporter [Pseudomonas chlororaphis]